MPKATQKTVDFGPTQANHQRVPWPDELVKNGVPLPVYFVGFLGNNVAPSTQEARQILNYRKSILKDTKGSAAKSDKTREKQLFACNVVLGPFRRLPNSVLHQIVLQCQDSIVPHGQDETQGISSHPHVPTLLSSVCKSLREVTHRTSDSWRTVPFAYSSWSQASTKQFMHRVQHFSQLSNGASLSISIGEMPASAKSKGSKHEENSDSNFTKALCWLFSSWDARDRLQTLSIRSSMLSTVPKVLQSLSKAKHKLPQHISSLLLQQPEYCTLNKDDITLILLSLPEVHQLWLEPLSSNRIGLPFDASITAWSNMTSIHLGDIFDLQYGWRELWTCCSRLVSAWVTVAPDEDWDPCFSEPIIVHRNLEELVLVLHVTDETSLITPFYRLQFSKLHSLDIHIAESIEDDLEPSVHRPMVKENVFPMLQTLRIHRFSFLSPMLKWRETIPLLTLAGSKTITSLSVSLSYKQIIDFFAFVGGTDNKGASRFPHLQSLCVEIDPSSKLTSKNMPRNGVVSGISNARSVIRRANHPGLSSAASPLDAVAVVIRVKTQPTQRCNLFPKERQVLQDYFSKIQTTFSGFENADDIQIEFVDLYNVDYWCRRDIYIEEAQHKMRFFN